MTTSCKVSICVPTYNRPELIVECLDSCLAQTHTNIEILIGDNSSDSRTQQLISERYAHDARIRYVKNEPPLSPARNVASLFARATGDKISLIHDDDYYASDGIANLLELWQQHPQLEVAFGDQYEVDMQGNVDVRKSAARMRKACRSSRGEQVSGRCFRTSAGWRMPISSSASAIATTSATAAITCSALSYVLPRRRCIICIAMCRTTALPTCRFRTARAARNSPLRCQHSNSCRD
jgi:glycosyltransferase involved in cell wall biosynthesis